MWSVLLSFCLSPFVIAQDTQRAVDAFTRDGVVPDVLPSFSPLATLDVVFTDPMTMQRLNVTPGMNLTTTQTSVEPQFFLNTTNTTFTNGTFVLAMVDPDAPTPQNTSISQVRHMLGGGFQVNSMTGMLINTTAALSDYMGPAPPAGSDAHRYVLLLFNQSATFMDNAPPLLNATPDRLNFNITQFASDVQLGTPIAGNFFFTAPDNTSSGTSSVAVSSAPLSTVFSTATDLPSSVMGGAAPTSAVAGAQTTNPGVSGSGTNGALSLGYTHSFDLILLACWAMLGLLIL